ncbi:uncharacterized protein DS421_5g134790 [Arachis hypogaea]|nr:uncharacterized protein DS421_5g134790 [Arachis hypogaea]
MIGTGYVMLVSSDTGAASLVHLYNALLTQHSVIISGRTSSGLEINANALITLVVGPENLRSISMISALPSDSFCFHALFCYDRKLMVDFAGSAVIC